MFESIVGKQRSCHQTTLGLARVAGRLEVDLAGQFEIRSWEGFAGDGFTENESRWTYHGVMPPLTHNVWPVTNAASSLAK